VALFIDGEPADAAGLTLPALVNYGAYTSFAVEDGGVRGLSLHLDRLEASATELFGASPGRGRLRTRMVQALDGRTDAWLRVSLFSRELGARTPDVVAMPSIMVGVFDRPAPLGADLRVQIQTHEREAPHLKHLSTFGLIRARRSARQAGFDDALFVDREGRVLEGSLWNVAFRKDGTVVWPQGPKLVGVTQTLIQRGLDQMGLAQSREIVRIADLSIFDAVMICNSATPAAAIVGIGDLAYDADPVWSSDLRRAWTLNPPERLV